MGFGQGLSGLNAASQNLDVIGNNIANSSTVGFKASTIAFADVYANSRVGLGVQVAAVNQRFTTGNLSTTGNQFDMAIDGEKGLFVLTDTNGGTVYSRNGQFHSNKNLNIENAQGQLLNGYLIDENGKVGAQIGPLQIPVGNIDPQATTRMTVKSNFDSRAEVIANVTREVVDNNGVVKPAFDPSEAENHTHSLPMTVYDSLGNPHQLTQYFVKVSGGADDVSEWDVFYHFDGKFLTSNDNTEAAGGASGDEANPTGTNPSGTAVGVGDYTQGESLLKHRLTFDPAGRIVGPFTEHRADDTDKIKVLPYDLTITGLGSTDGSPAEDLVITLDYNDSTQFGGAFSPSTSQDGYSTGEFSSVSISENGEVVANYTNGKLKTIGAVVLADFKNVNGLKPIGGNAWIETAESGEPSIGRPGTNGMATLKGQMVEESNVDMGQELVNMIIAQRTYQANAQTIKTQDQVLQTLVTLR